MQNGKNTLILGIGNILWADEGFGVRAVERMFELYEFSENVAIVEGGTQGVYLLEYVQRAERIIIFDAVDFGLEPSALHCVENENVPQYMGAKKVSLHQTGFQEVLAMAYMLDSLPKEMLLIGVQPVVLEDYGGSLHPMTHAKIDPAIDIARRWLGERGINATLRDKPIGENLSGQEINLERYEGERPDNSVALRMGDDRVIFSKRYQIAYRPYPLSPNKKIKCDVDARGKY